MTNEKRLPSEEAEKEVLGAWVDAPIAKAIKDKAAKEKRSVSFVIAEILSSWAALKPSKSR